VERAAGAGAVQFAVKTARRMLAEALAQLEICPQNKYRDALGGLCGTLDGMLEQFV
jgi:hypothetical protein